MSVTKLHPVTLPKIDASNHDRIMAALNQALKDQEEDHAAGDGARGVVILWLREKPNAFSESWIIQGMSTLEAIGLLHVTAVDLASSSERDDGCYPKDPA